MQIKLRSLPRKQQAANTAAGKFIPFGVERVAQVPLLSSEEPPPAPTPTFYPTRTPRPTQTPTSTPPPQPTPTPASGIGFNYTSSFTGPGESEELSLIVAPNQIGSFDTFFVNEPTEEPTFLMYRMNVYINNQLRVTVEYNQNRANTQFGYKPSYTLSNVPQYVGIFPNVNPLENPLGGNVYF